MDKDLLKTLLKFEVAILVKKGMNIKDATEQAGKKLDEDMKQAEFESYCSEHNC